MSASVTNLREYVLIVQEPQLMVPVHADADIASGPYVVQTKAPIAPPSSSTPPATVPNAIFIRIDGGNAFTMRAKPVTENITSGGGYAYLGQVVSGRTSCVGTLQTKLYGSQSAFLLGWATMLVNNATVTFPSGQGVAAGARKVPWVTLAPDANGVGGTALGDLASCSIYHAIRRSDGTYRCRLYSGVKVMGGTLACSSDSQIATLNLNLQGCRYAGDPFGGSDVTAAAGSPIIWANDPAQVDAATLNDPMKIPDPVWYPTDPFLFTHTAKLLKIYPTGDSAPSTLYRTQISSLSLNFGNRCDARFFENRYANYIQFLGRQATLTAKILYKPKGGIGMSATHDDRDSLETLAGCTMSVGFNTGASTANAIVGISFDFKAANIISDIADDTPVDRVYEQTITVQNTYDYTGGSPADFSFYWNQHA